MAPGITEQERRAIQFFRDHDQLTFHTIGRRLNRAAKTIETYYARDCKNPAFAYDPGAPPLPREQTLVLFKPDAVRKRIVGKIIERFESYGLDLVLSRRTTITNPNVVHQHHPDLLTKHGGVIASAVVAYMTSGPLIVAKFEGVDAIAAVRNLIGPTFPGDAKRSPKGTIRGDFSTMTRAGVLRTGVMTGNVIHGSRDADEARRELAMWFGRSACGR